LRDGVVPGGASLGRVFQGLPSTVRPRAKKIVAPAI
jgi:hypothetical protein